MQAADTVILPEKPYAYQGLTVQGVTPYRLTPRPDENLEVPDEVGHAIVARLLVRKLIEPRLAIAMAGLGVQPAGLTVRAHVQAMITTAGLARVAANIRAREVDSTKTDLTPTPAHRSETVEHTEPTRYLLDDDGSMIPQGQRILMSNDDMEVEF